MRAPAPPAGRRGRAALRRGLRYRQRYADLGLSTSAIKRQYQRPRPFTTNGQPTCTPGFEKLLRQDGSYPSDLDTNGGHVGTTADFATPIYHYHSSRVSYMNSRFYILKAGSYHGNKGTFTF